MADPYSGMIERLEVRRLEIIERMNGIDLAIDGRGLPTDADVADIQSRGYTLREIGAVFGVSRQRVHQVLVRHSKDCGE